MQHNINNINHSQTLIQLIAMKKVVVINQLTHAIPFGLVLVFKSSTQSNSLMSSTCVNFTPCVNRAVVDFPRSQICTQIHFIHILVCLHCLFLEMNLCFLSMLLWDSLNVQLCRSWRREAEF